MKVILKEEVKGLGKIGDVVNVAEGYGRNFLIPGRKVVEANAENMRVVEQEKKKAAETLKRSLHEAKELSEKINGSSITIARQVGEGEKMFGSVTSADIAEALEKEGLNIDKRYVHLEKPIKELGLVHVPIKIHPDISAELKVWIVKA